MKLIKKVDGMNINRETIGSKDTLEYYKNEFLKRRAQIAKLTYGKGSIEIEDIYADKYVEQCELAVGGDVVAQDMLSYWFKHSNPAVPENIEMSYKWLFLAGANGNKHSLNKLTLFFNYAYDSIIFSDYYQDLLPILDIDNDNYQFLLGQVICDELVKELHIDALELAKQKVIEIKYDQLIMQRFTRALNTAMVKVDEYFRNLIEKSKKGF